MVELETAKKSDKPVLLLMHGMGCGHGVFVNNLDALAEHYHVYAIDILGFGGSSRVTFPKDKDGQAAEDLFVDSIDAWKRQMGIKKMVIGGHSFGGYLSACYALRHPENVSGLLLVDPWGFSEVNPEEVKKRSWSRRALGTLFFEILEPIKVLRVLGPWGPGLFNRVRQHMVGSTHDPSAREAMLHYLYHANAHASGTGASAFQTLCLPFAYAKRPLLQRIANLPSDLPVQFIYGSRSWISSSSGLLARAIRGPAAYTGVETIKGAGHNVHLDQPELFNQLMANVAKKLTGMRPGLR
mmetsp:Transcript_5068/g.10137  ORF Transcript_5068/g.10137 Transcript_5068/m.10137 type:complete len:297 (-) Transcript_5068:209-1099(-)